MDSCSYFKLIGCFILISIAIVPTQGCFPLDCQEAYKNGTVCSGVYTVKPDNLPAFDVYCDMSNGGGWTVFQRRMNDKTDFYLNWDDYQYGFGDLDKEFWLGLYYINRLTDLEDFDGNKKYATYSTFKVGNADTEYKLTVSGYAGNAGDSLSYHNGAEFSTKDQDNDDSSGNCATSYDGAWWYKNCHLSNLNGLYLVGSHSSYANGVNWYHFKGYHYSLKTTEMKLGSS
ncbi:PREDICTED: ryncolin-1-like [Amphimedon queenslandica]|uniref:Fibrinogen C-terminal domain-containing protein n=1 Tax=Amphimedon queenslandica TaxID=400682 RepID=A0A1X7TT50_AMPQE|nr:PREDICTED: ryncolin-1-like [Amphimedon queenslandica]|eukprot:XP_019857844.1 PREDICTED: ryncolin-1-like [Amphimedon queenslandica]